MSPTLPFHHAELPDSKNEISGYIPLPSGIGKRIQLWATAISLALLTLLPSSIVLVDSRGPFNICAALSLVCYAFMICTQLVAVLLYTQYALGRLLYLTHRHTCEALERMQISHYILVGIYIFTLLCTESEPFRKLDRSFTGGSLLYMIIYATFVYLLQCACLAFADEPGEANWDRRDSTNYEGKSSCKRIIAFSILVTVFAIAYLSPRSPFFVDS